MNDFCLYCENNVYVDVYAGGGYTTTVRCQECERSRETVLRTVVIDGQKQQVAFHKYADGVMPFRKFMGREPMTFRKELALARKHVDRYHEYHENVNPWIAKDKPLKAYLLAHPEEIIDQNLEIGKDG